MEGCADGQRWFSVGFGSPDEQRGSGVRYIPAAIRQHEGTATESLALENNSPCLPDKPFMLVVQVGKDSIELLYNKRSVLRSSRDKTRWGQVGFGGWRSYDEITIEGKADRSWLQGLLDKKQSEAIARLEAAWDQARALPDWLQAACAVATKGSSRTANPRSRAGNMCGCPTG